MQASREDPVSAPRAFLELLFGLPEAEHSEEHLAQGRLGLAGLDVDRLDVGADR